VTKSEFDMNQFLKKAERRCLSNPKSRDDNVFSPKSQNKVSNNTENKKVNRARVFQRLHTFHMKRKLTDQYDKINKLQADKKANLFHSFKNKKHLQLDTQYTMKMHTTNRPNGDLFSPQPRVNGFFQRPQKKQLLAYDENFKVTLNEAVDAETVIPELIGKGKTGDTSFLACMKRSRFDSKCTDTSTNESPDNIASRKSNCFNSNEGLRKKRDHYRTSR